MNKAVIDNFFPNGSIQTSRVRSNPVLSPIYFIIYYLAGGRSSSNRLRQRSQETCGPGSPLVLHLTNEPLALVVVLVFSA